MSFRKKYFCFFLCIVFCLAVVPFRTIAAESQLTVGSNVEYQRYDTWATPVYSYLVGTANGELMRVQAGYYKQHSNWVGTRDELIRENEVVSTDGYYVEYYDASYQLLRSLRVKTELERFGGFYATDSNYYILSGQDNPGESASVECFRITKYDLEWNRLASVGLYDCNTTVPFDAGSARFAQAGKYLLIRTAHEMYTSSDGLNHQANVTMQVDTEAMEITDSFTGIMNSSYGYASHSFNQFIQVENGHIVAVDHGDAFPRGVALFQYPTDVSGGKFVSSGCTMTYFTEFEGGIGENYTGVSVGGFEISNSSYLVAYNAVKNFSQDNTRNIYVASIDKATEKVTVKQVTNFAEGTESASTPHLVKVSANTFVLLWSQAGNVFYAELNGQGDVVGEPHSIKNAALSDCVPVLTGEKLVWYTHTGSAVTFYEIDTNDLSKNTQTTPDKVGDIDGNGDIDASDYMLVKRFVLGTFGLTKEQQAAADVNNDGIVDEIDYMLIKRHVLGSYTIA